MEKQLLQDVVFDEALNRVWERRVKLRELDKDIEQKQFLVDDADLREQMGQ